MSIYIPKGKDYAERRETEIMNQPSMEGKFINQLVEIVVDALGVHWNDRRIITALLKTSIREKLDHRFGGEGLLQQYEAYVLDHAGARIKHDLGIPEDVVVNHDYATHAKYADIVDYIKENFEEKIDLSENAEADPPEKDRVYDLSEGGDLNKNPSEA